MGFLDQVKDMYKLQKQAKELKKQLKNLHIEAEHEGVTITVDGEQEFVEVKISDSLSGDLRKIEKLVLEASNKAIKKAQEVAAEKMKTVMGGLGGLFGQGQEPAAEPPEQK